MCVCVCVRVCFGLYGIMRSRGRESKHRAGLLVEIYADSCPRWALDIRLEWKVPISMRMNNSQISFRLHAFFYQKREPRPRRVADDDDECRLLEGIRLEDAQRSARNGVFAFWGFKKGFGTKLDYLSRFHIEWRVWLSSLSWRLVPINRAVMVAFKMHIIKGILLTFFLKEVGKISELLKPVRTICFVIRLFIFSSFLFASCWRHVFPSFFKNTFLNTN